MLVQSESLLSSVFSLSLSLSLSFSLIVPVRSSLWRRSLWCCTVLVRFFDEEQRLFEHFCSECYPWWTKQYFLRDWHMFVSSVVKSIEDKTNHMLQISSTLRYSWRSVTSRSSFMWQSQDWFLNMWRRLGYMLDFRGTAQGGERCEGDYELQILRHGFQIFQGIRQESVEESTLWMKLTRCIFWNGEEICNARRAGNLLGCEGDRENQFCSISWTDNFWIMSERHTDLARMVKELTLGWRRSLNHLWWFSVCAVEDTTMRIEEVGNFWVLSRSWGMWRVGEQIHE